MAHLFISAAHKSSGKTTLSMGLCRALCDRHSTVQAYKKGPDYIDPMWLAQATGRACYNLDFYTQSRQEISQVFSSRGADADICLIEGNKGLYDGLDLDGSNSNAALARLLGVPVVLVIDARGMTRGIAPLILGYQAFEPTIHIAGVILNQLGGSRHESKLRAVIEHYTHVPVVGAVHRDPSLALVERHLGLMPSSETPQAEQLIQNIAAAVAAQVDLRAIKAIAGSAATIGQVQAINSRAPAISMSRPLRIAVAKDRAFGFYYPDDFDALRRQGAELEFFDSLTDQRLPRADALFIGGGFPETHLQPLQANRAMRSAIAEAVHNGMPVYAECGGLMYLSRSIQWQGETFEMVGCIGADVVMHDKPQGRGYVRLSETVHHPWPSEQGEEIVGHEFHYSSLVNRDPSFRYAYKVQRGFGISGKYDGVMVNNVLACYSHLRDTQRNHWTTRFIRFIQQCKSGASKRSAGL